MTQVNLRDTKKVEAWVCTIGVLVLQFLRVDVLDVVALHVKAAVRSRVFTTGLVFSAVYCHSYCTPCSIKIPRAHVHLC